MIVYRHDLSGISADMLTGFFEGWKVIPSKEKHLRILENSSHKIIAIDTTRNKVIGFINAVSDNVLSAYIPLLEVIPEYRKRGIGKELLKRMLEQLKDFYMIDLVCDEKLNSFYEAEGMNQYNAMIIRNAITPDVRR